MVRVEYRFTHRGGDHPYEYAVSLTTREGDALGRLAQRLETPAAVCGALKAAIERAIQAEANT